MKKFLLILLTLIIAVAFMGCDIRPVRPESTLTICVEPWPEGVITEMP